MSFVQGGAGRLRVSDGGIGDPVLVLLHGLGSDLETWRPVLERLRPSHRAIAYDQRGHGGSDPAPEYSVELLADDLERVVQALQLRKFWLVGHSFSGTVVTAYAGRHPEQIAGIVYVDAVGDASHASPELKESFRKYGQGMTTKARVRDSYAEMLGPPGTREAVLDASARTDLQAIAALRASMLAFDGLSAARLYPGRRVAIQVEGNDFPGAAAQLPATHLIVVPGVSHWLMLDDPDATARAIEEATR
jgi:pimeloyl-ACP methyl ester carboxylesterase